MSSRKRMNSNDDDEIPANLRQNLPRRCKELPTFYTIDMDIDDGHRNNDHHDDHRGSRTSSSTMVRTNKRAAREISKKAAARQQHAEKMKNQMMVLTILSWLLDMKVVKVNETVWYRTKTVSRKGHLVRAGIVCHGSCCESVTPVSVSEFVTHGGGGFWEWNPYSNLYVGGRGNVPLVTCMIEAWNRHSVPARDGWHHVVRRPRVRDNHDDSCLICADGGDLLCCDKCPSTYHQKCLGFEDVPRGEWLCPYCRCKYCDRGDSSDILLTCFQCLKKYHSQCFDAKDHAHMQPSITPFCGTTCFELHRNLEQMVGRTMPISGATSWTLVRRMDLDTAALNSNDVETRAICNATVALVAKLMESSFNAIVDRQTRSNIIQSVIYNCGSNFTRTNFSRFYTAVLEWHGHIVTVASIRMPSPTLAEIPFIVTDEKSRNKGMCKTLLSALESALHGIGVKHIVIPSAEETVEKWQRKNFGFSPLDEGIRNKITTLNTLMFPKTVRLQKEIQRENIVADLNLPPDHAED